MGLRGNLNRLKELRDGYKISEKQEEHYGSKVYQEVAADKELGPIQTELQFQHGLANGYNIIQGYCAAVSEKKMVSGHALYSDLRKNQIFMPGLDLDENKARFFQLSEFTSGKKEVLDKNKKYMKELWVLVEPLVTAQVAVQTALTGSLIRRFEEAINSGSIKAR